jgi:hypothetical protein
VTYFFTDLEGSTRLWDIDPVGDERGLGAPRRDPPERHRVREGYEFRHSDVGFSAAFRRADNATLEIKEAMTNDQSAGLY